MRFFNGLALAGLAGSAVGATHDPAEVYILTSNPSDYRSNGSPKDQLPRQLARDILFQRLMVDNRLSSDIVGEKTLEYISKYGSTTKPLFGAEGIAPSQLVVLLEGVTEDNVKPLKEAIYEEGHSEPAFRILDAPSAKANKHLVDVEFAATGTSGSCDAAAAVNPYGSCWSGMSLAVKYDVAKNPNELQSLIDNLPSLFKTISSGTLEATLVLIPESTRSSKHAYWTDGVPTDLRRRVLQESPISDTKNEKVTTSPSSGGIDLTYNAGAAAEKMNLGCFSSYSSCVSATNNCTGHGKCMDKYLVPGQDTKEGDKQCFVCNCLSTRKTPEDANSKHVHWGGAYCQKVDVSSPFWLIASTTIILVGIVTGCIGMLFSVGEEKLPGVIGAGVSRSK
ncbi:hypothetical protein VSDG_03030 [Cytospora chrysosperma]|uniref:Vacuolar sorting protein Vps3844 C-terminal domain-containing protein n=1 Tax=Cytospora chrysosperma TaxID=252740 RepID=A0A423W8X8_CYTCH|nr:hypothetical protein VSDG_03030 [Valsa sordida]